jgi:S-adenosylmethionine-diacylglycerol 3-amino-3-carboxypropyl transferase
VTAPAFVRAPSALATALAGELRYSTVWEDHLLLEEGLRIGADDELLVVAGAGCNVLNLLLHAPRRIVAIDFNPAQTALVELKLAALRVVSHPEMLVLLGVSAGRNRVAIYERVRSVLSSAARDWWDTHLGIIADGIEGAGRLERYIAGFRNGHLSRLHSPEIIAALFELDSVKARHRFVEDLLLMPAVEDAFRSYFTRESLSSRGRSPEQLRYAEKPDVSEWFLRRLRWACTELPTRGNFYLERFFLGHVRDIEAGAPYLRRSAFERLRALASRVEVVTEPLDTYLASTRDRQLTKAALSDVFEYLSPLESEALFARLAGAMRGGGRIAYWNLFVPRQSPATQRHRFRPLDRLSRALAHRDRAWFYSAFHVEEVCAV